MYAKKSLGQHFLTSEKAIRDIVSASHITPTDTILEIGPGRGMLTKHLLATGAHVIAIEKDNSLIPLLTDMFREEIARGQFVLIHGDVLTEDISTIVTDAYKVVANIPYYITGEILRLFLESNNPPQSLTLLVQKEVADRIMARDKKESILSLSVKVFGNPTYISTVKAGSFNPPPKVDSAIIYIETHNQFSNVSKKDFFALIKTGLAHKRKKLFSNLTGLYSKDALARAFEICSLDTNLRGEDLTLTEWVSLLTELS